MKYVKPLKSFSLSSDHLNITAIHAGNLKALKFLDEVPHERLWFSPSSLLRFACCQHAASENIVLHLLRNGAYINDVLTIGKLCGPRTVNFIEGLTDNEMICDLIGICALDCAVINKLNLPISLLLENGAKMSGLVVDMIPTTNKKLFKSRDGSQEIRKRICGACEAHPHIFLNNLNILHKVVCVERKIYLLCSEKLDTNLKLPYIDHVIHLNQMIQVSAKKWRVAAFSGNLVLTIDYNMAVTKHELKNIRKLALK